MITEYDKVRIRENGIVGEVIDIYTINGNTYYTVESDEKGVPGGYGDANDWKLFDCELDDLEKI